jgi:hypothetical protein
MADRPDGQTARHWRPKATASATRRFRDILRGAGRRPTHGLRHPPPNGMVLAQMRPLNGIRLPRWNDRLQQVVVEVVGVPDAGRQAMPALLHCLSRESTIRRSNPEKSVSPCLGRFTSNAQGGGGLCS